MMVELRGIEVCWDGSDKVICAIIRVDRPDNYVRYEVFRNQAVTRGRIISSLASCHGIGPDKIIWPAHIKVIDI